MNEGSMNNERKRKVMYLVNVSPMECLDHSKGRMEQRKQVRG